MLNRDDEDKMRYVTKRVVQRGDIVCFVCVYLHNVVGQEEPHSIHVVDLKLVHNELK